MLNPFKKFFLSLSLFLVLVTTASAKRAFIIDTDVGSDDQVAMLYLLKRPEIDVKAITIATTGEAHCQPAMQNVMRILQLTHQTNVPIACGREQPLSGKHRFPDWLRTKADVTVSKIKIPSHTLTATTLFIKKLQTAAPKSVDVLTIGPLTNIAEALLKKPEIKNKIRMIYIMGGAINVKGNISDVDKTLDNQRAEWNIFIDPKAADVVLRSGIPITLIPLDITNQVPVNYDFYQQLKAHQQFGSVKFVYEIYHRIESQIISHHWYYWDILAAVIASHEAIASMEMKKIRVILAPESESGATVLDDKKGIDVRVCWKVDEKQFKQLLLSTLESE